MYKLILIFLMMAMFSTQLSAGQQSLDRIAAIVNDEIITVQQVQNAMHTTQIQLKQMHQPIPSQHTLYTTTLDQLIDRKLQLQMAKNMGIEVTDAIVANAINEIAKRNNLTFDAFKQRLVADGFNYVEYQQEIRDQMMISQVQQRHLMPTISVSDAEVKQIQSKLKPIQEGTSRYHLIDIFIPISERATPQQITAAQAKAQKILNEVHKGANFLNLAMTQATESHLSNSGDFGWQTLDQLPELFAEKVKHMSSGQVDGPIRAGNGLHIIQLEGIQNSDFAHHYTKETHVRHILIKLDKTTNDEIAKMHLLQLKAKLNQGASFAEIAQANSQDHLSNTKGGDLGWVAEGVLDPHFERVMNQLKTNQVGGPVKTPFGWHLMQVLSRRQVEDTKNLISNQARNIAYQQKMQQALPAWLQQLRSTAYVKKYST
jgi:peptidyl-prolyl cis-trans isomerase SurA